MREAVRDRRAAAVLVMGGIRYELNVRSYELERKTPPTHRERVTLDLDADVVAKAELPSFVTEEVMGFADE